MAFGELPDFILPVAEALKLTNNLFPSKFFFFSIFNLFYFFFTKKNI